MDLQSYFFSLTRAYLQSTIDAKFATALGNMFSLVGAIAGSLTIIWIIFQGYRIMAGQSRHNLMGFLIEGAKTVTILAFATSAGLLIGGGTGDGIIDIFRDTITSKVTDDSANIYSKIDDNLNDMSTNLATANAINTGGDPTLESDKRTAAYLTGFGQAAPSMVAGVMLLLNDIMISIGTMLAPLFILLLLFDQTKAYFQRWVSLMLSLFFSLAILSIMSSVCMDLSSKFAALSALSTIYSTLLSDGNPPSLMTSAMQQGGLGLLLTALLVTVPPMVASFFNAALGGVANNLFVPPSSKDDTKNTNSYSNNTNNTQKTDPITPFSPEVKQLNTQASQYTPPSNPDNQPRSTGLSSGKHGAANNTLAGAAIRARQNNNTENKS